MYLIKKGFNFGSALSTVLDKLSSSNGREDDGQGRNSPFGRTEHLTRMIDGDFDLPFDLHFHPAHGKAITLNSDFSIASRDDRYFEHSVVFSHRPIRIHETIAVEVIETSADFHGPLRIGFTSCNPEIFQNVVVPLARDLKNVNGFWIKSVQLFPMKVGTVVYFTVKPDGVVLYGVDGENGGIFLKDVDVSGPLWAVLEAYGSVQSLKFVNKRMLLIDRTSEDYLDLNSNSPNLLSQNLHARTTRQSGRIREMNLPLNLRRNVRLAPLQNIASSQNPKSILTPAFNTPMSPSQFSPGLCIICTEREKNTAFAKCGHICMCFECAEEFKINMARVGSRSIRKKNLCPVCRRPITSTLRIYY